MHMAKPEKFPVKKVIGFDRQMLEEIEAYRRTQDPIPNVSEAIRRLVAVALQASPQI